MLGYVTIGTNDLERATAFYGKIAEMLGHGLIMENERMVMWGSPGEGAMVSVCKPYDQAPATSGNGTMFGLLASSKELVDEVYGFALANGGSDEGPPGSRGGSFYGGYFRDPDGNKLVVYTILAD